MKIQKIDFFLALIVAVTIAGILRQIVGGWGWDINHMMYFGQRLLAGDFHWTQEFDDKLPVLQIIFTLPAALDSFAAWRTISLTLMFAGAVAVYCFIDDILRQSTKMSSKDRLRYGLLGGASSLYLAVFLPGGIHHINTPAASLAAIALAALALSFRPYKSRYFSAALILLSAFAASVAIGIRPYFLLPLIVGAVWLHFRATKSRDEVLRTFGASIIWVCLVGAFGLLVNFLPYIFLGNTNAFFAGMTVLGQTLNPQSAFEVALSIYGTFVRQGSMLQAMIVFSLTSCLYAIFKLLSASETYPLGIITQRKLFLDIVVFSLVIPVILLVSIFGRHFWSHYLQMFGPFVGTGFAVFFALLHDQVIKQTADASRMLSALVLSFGVTLALPSIASDLKTYFSSRTEPTILDQIARSVEEVVLEQPDNRRSFLFLSGRGSMYTHWKLSEPRHGFPHAANTAHIIKRNWWESVEIPIHFSHPTDAEEYCSEIEASGPAIIVLGEPLREFAEFCLSQSVAYNHFRNIPDHNLAVFVRRQGSTE